MNLRPAILAAAAALTLAGCAATQHASTTAQSRTAAGAMTPGMIMPDGSTMGPAVAQAAADQPSAAAKMICTAETRTTITKILGLSSIPAPTPRWAQQAYSCSYRLPQGTLTLMVKEAASPAAAHEYATELRDQLSATRTVAGLTTDAYRAGDSKVVLVKDNDTLIVDASALPPTVGTLHAKRFDFTYELASDILGCWTGDDGT